MGIAQGHLLLGDCAAAAAALAAQTNSRDPLILQWLAEKSRWKRVEISALSDTN